MTQLTKEQLDAWARTRLRMLVAHLKAMLVRGEVFPNDPM